MMESFDESSKMLQVESSNTVSIHLWKHNLINIKPKGVKTKDEFIEKHKLSNVNNSSQDTGYYVDSRQCDTTEGSLAVLNLVHFVDKRNVMCPKRLGESYSYTARSTFRQHEPRIKRHKINHKDNAPVRKRFRSYKTISKRRSYLLKTILCTKFTQSTPSQCTYNLKSCEKKKSQYKNNILVESKQHQTKYCRKTEGTFEGAKQRQSDIAPNLKKVIHQIIDNIPKKQDTRMGSLQEEENQRTKGRNEFGFSRLSSNSKDSNTCVISSDLSISGRDKVLSTKNNYKIYKKKHNQYTNKNSENNLLIKSTSPRSVTCSAETQNLFKSYIWNKVRYYSSKDSCNITSPKEKHVDPRFADQFTSRYKKKNQVNTCETKWDFSFMSKRNKSISYTNSPISSSSKEAYEPSITNTEYQMKRRKIARKYQSKHMSSNSKHNNLRHTEWNIMNANKKTLVKYNSNKTSESNSSIVVSMAKIQRLPKNDQVIIIGPKGRGVRCKDRNIRSQTNIKQNQLSSDDVKATTKCKEIIVQNFFLTTNNDMPRKITKETKNNRFYGFKMDTEASISNTEKKQSIFLNRIAKYFSPFAKKKKQKVNTCTDVPSLYNKCYALEKDIYNDNNPNSIRSNKYTNKKSDIKRVQNINIVCKNKSNENCSDAQNIASRKRDDQFVKYIGLKNHYIKRYGVKNKLKYLLSPLHICNKYLDNHKKYTQQINTNSKNSKAQYLIETNKGTKAPQGSILHKQYDLDKSEFNVIDGTGAESCRDEKSPVLYYISYREPSSSRHIIKDIKQRKHHYDRQNNRFKFTQAPLPDALSYGFNKYNFSEDELIRKAIKTAIKHQILKTSYSKLAKLKRKKKYLKKSGHQYTGQNSFAQRFYAMNLHHLKPYECEPGVCVPDINRCNPNERIKLIHKRLKKSCSTTTTLDTKSVKPSKKAHKSKYHGKQEYRAPRRREESIETCAPRKHSIPSGGGGATYSKLGKKRSKKKHAVRVGSSFNLNVEFSKGKSGGSETLKTSKEGRYKTQMKKDKKVKKQKAARRTKYKHKDSSTTTSEPNKHEHLKRCSCTLKLQQKQSKSTRRNLCPHECEPNVCIPGRCDPKQCLKRIKYRDRGFNAESVPVTCRCTSSSGTSPMKPVKPKKSPLANAEKTKRRKGRKLHQKKSRVHKELRGQLNSDKIPTKQAVKIGSTFSFSLEFYKNVAPPVIEIVPDPTHPKAISPASTIRGRKLGPPSTFSKQKMRAKKVGRRSSGTSNITDFSVDRGSEPWSVHSVRSQRRKRTEVYGLKDQGVESRMAPAKIRKTRGTATLRRCLCSLKLHKEGLVPAGQLVKHQGTATEKYKKKTNTGKLMPYECEPGVCIPCECNPSECYKRIREKYCKDHPSKTIYPGRIPRSQSTATYYKHASMGTKRPKRPRLSCGQGFEPVYCDVSQSIKTIVEEPRYRPILRKTRQVVRLGSDFKFNIELFKDKVEHKAERIPEPSPRSRIPWSKTTKRKPKADKPEAKRQKLIIKCARTYKQEIEEPTVIKRRSFFRGSRPYKEPPNKPIAICKCPEKNAEQKCKVAQANAKKADKNTKKSQLIPKTSKSVMTSLKRCFCTLKLKKKEKDQAVYTAVLNSYESPYHCREKMYTRKAMTDQYNKNSNSRAETHKYCKETETLLNEVLGQPQLSFLPQEYCVSNINDNNLVNSQTYFGDNQLSRDKWQSSVTGYLPYCQNNICATIVGNNTSRPKTYKANKYNLTSSTKTGKNNSKEKLPLIKDNKTSEKKLNKLRKRDGEYIKNKINANILFCTRSSKPSRYPKESCYQSNVVENSRFKLIKEPFRQAVRTASSFSLSLEFSRDKLPDVLKSPCIPNKRTQHKNTGIKVQSSRKKLEATEKRVCIRVGQIKHCPGPKKLKKVINVIEMKNKNISCDLPLKPLKADACVSKKKDKYKITPFGCDPTCDLDNFTCSTKKGSKKLSRRSLLPKRESVKIGSKLNCNVELFKDQNYLGEFCHTGGPNTHSMKAGHPRQPVSTVRSAFKKCLCALKFQKQIVNYLSIHSKSPFRKLEHLNVAERYSWHSKYKLHTDNGSKHTLASHQMLNNDKYDNNILSLKTKVKSELKSNSEMETIYPYIPQKFNRSSKNLPYKDANKQTTRDCDSKYQNRKYRRKDKTYKDPETYCGSQNFILGSIKNLFADRFLLALKHRIFKRPPHCQDKQFNLMQKIRRKRSLPAQRISNISCKHNSKTMSQCSKKQHQNTVETSKVSNTERRPMQTKLIKHPRKSESARSIIIETLEKRQKKRHEDQSHYMYSYYLSENADKCIKYVKTSTSDFESCASYHYENKSKNLNPKQNLKINPYMDNKLVYRVSANQPARTKKKPGIDQALKQYERPKARYQAQHQYKYESRYEDRNNIKPLFDMLLNAADMSLLNKNNIYDKVLELKRIQSKDYRKRLKIDRQSHGDSCCCCVCKQQKNLTEHSLHRHRHHQGSQARKNSHDCKKKIVGLKNAKNIKCKCQSKECEKTFQRDHLEKQLRANIKACVRGTKMSKKEILKRIDKKNISTEGRRKLKHKLDSARKKREDKTKKNYFKEIASEVKRKQKASDKSEKLAAKRLKKLKGSHNCFLCIDALIDLIKYTVLTLYGAVKGLVKAIIDPKRAYFKLRYPQKTLTLNQLQPTSLTALASRMKTRLAYAGFEMKNPHIAAMLTSVDGKKQKIKKKKEDPRPNIVSKNKDLKCSLYMSSLRRRPFLNVYYKCPWFYPKCLSLVSIGKNLLELLLICLAILVWSPCLLAVELVRGLMCCTMCTG